MYTDKDKQRHRQPYLDEAEELVVVPPVVVQLYLTHKLDLDSVVFQSSCLAVQGHVYLHKRF